MKIAIIGHGNVGGALAKRLSGLGHKVMIGVRRLNDEKAAALVDENTELGGIHEAAAWADAIVLAVPFAAVPDVMEAAGSLKDKVLLDATNPLLGLDALKLGTTTSGAEHVQELAVGAKVAKVFNMTGSGNMADPSYPEGKPTMFFCGDDVIAKDVARNLAEELGFEPVDAGPLTQSRVLEPLALLWVTLAYKQDLGPNIAFRLMKR